MAGITIDISEIDVMIKKVEDLKPKIFQGIDQILNAGAIEIASKAKQLAPKDRGTISQQTSADTSKFLEKTVAVNAPYSAFVEFGTGKYAAAYVATLPQTWQEYARGFKGLKGNGSFDEFLENIYQWVRRKQIGATFNVKTKRRDKQGKQTAETTDRATAYMIAIRILQNGVHPHPFLFPAYEEQRPKIISDAKAFLNSLK